MNKAAIAAHYTALVAEAKAEVVGYRFPLDLTTEMVCVDPECLAKYADLMATVAVPMTEADVAEWQNSHDGKVAYCASCSTDLDGLGR